MAILGGAVLPAIMGRISDATSIRTAFIVPLLCYIYIFYFAVDGYKPGNAVSDDTAAMVRVAHES
jgi:FHS family L-fucose permease-like MFS transporter